MDDCGRSIFAFPLRPSGAERLGEVGRPRGSDASLGHSALLQFLPNSLHDSFEILHHVRVPESNHAIAISCQFASAELVAPRIRMLAPVEFDHELSRHTCEVGNALSDRMLSSESPRQSILPERVPQTPLDLGRFTAQSARVDCSLAQWHGPTSPNLSAPQGRRGKSNMECR